MRDHAIGEADELIVKTSLGKTLLIFLLSLGFAALSVWLINKQPLIGWVGTVFAGLGILASLLMMRPNYMYLRLDRDGFDCVRGSRHSRTRWRDVQRFQLVSLNGNKMIGIDYSPDYAAQKTGRAIAGSLAGIEGAIANHYAMPIDDLLKTLESYRRRYG
jgi:hypothetical protein